MRIALVGGTGREGRGLAVRWAKAGHEVTIGSRDAERARQRAEELSAAHGVTLRGTGNEEALRGADVAVISVPFDAHASTFESLKSSLARLVVIDITVPLKPPKVRQVHLPEAGSAANQARSILGPDARIVATLHHVSSTHLGEPGHEIDSDVLVAADDAGARDVAMSLVRDLGMRALDAGPLQNAVALESLTPVLLHLNKRYGSDGVGIRITGLPEGTS